MKRKQFEETAAIIEQSGLSIPFVHSLPGHTVGKWSEDEEKYAYELIQRFTEGILDDCDDGERLRPYLARKLDCDIMRISKKLANQVKGIKGYRRHSRLRIHDAMGR